MQKENDNYLSYNSLARKASFYGIPIKLFVLLLIIFVLFFLIGLYLKSKIPFIVSGLVVAIMMFIKMINENDSRAIYRLKYKVKGAVIKFQYGWNTTIVSMINSKKRQMEKVSDFFKEFNK